MINFKASYNKYNMGPVNFGTRVPATKNRDTALEERRKCWTCLAALEAQPPPPKALPGQWQKPTLHARARAEHKKLSLYLSRKHFLACAGIYDATTLSLKAHSVRTALSAGWEEKHTLRRRKCPVCSALDSVWVTQRGVSGSINFSIQNSTHRTRRVAANKLFKVFFFGEFFIHRKIHKNERIVCKYIENWKLKLAQKFL